MSRFLTTYGKGHTYGDILDRLNTYKANPESVWHILDYIYEHEKERDKQSPPPHDKKWEELLVRDYENWTGKNLKTLKKPS